MLHRNASARFSPFDAARGSVRNFVCEAGGWLGLTGEALSEQDGEVIHGAIPPGGTGDPFYGDVAQRQPEQLGRRVVIREVATRLDDLAQLPVHVLKGVGRVEQATNGGRKREEGDDVRPRTPPSRTHGRKPLSERRGLERLQRDQRGGFSRGCLDRFERGGEQ